MAVPRKRLAVLPLAALVVALAAPSGELSSSRGAAGDTIAQQPNPYEATKQRGAPVAVLMRPTVLRAAPGGRRIARLRRRTEWRSPRVLAAVESRGRWLKVLASELPNGRRGWIPMSAVKLVANPWSVRADLSRRRVVVRRNGRVVKRFSVAVGRPSTPTPRGRFAVTDKLEIIGGSAAYGCCVLALSGHQTHIEPGWSGGNRLAIHGTLQTGTIGHAASFGCLRARERDVRWLVRNVFLGTIVEIRR